MDTPSTALEHCIDASAVIHDQALVDTPAQIGGHTRIMPFAHIMAHALIGSNCHVGQNSTLYSGVIIGQHTTVMENVRLNSGVILQDDVVCGPSVTVSSPSNIRGRLSKKVLRISPTLIQHKATIGPNCTISSGLTIGKHAFIEANTVVDKNIPNFSVVSGNPLKIIGWRCQCGEWLTFKSSTQSQSSHTECHHCGLTYQQLNEHTIHRTNAAGDIEDAHAVQLHIPRKHA